MTTRMFGGAVFNDENAPSVHAGKQLNSRPTQSLRQSLNPPIKPSINPSNNQSIKQSNKLSGTPIVRRGLVDITNKNNTNDSGPSKTFGKPLLKPRQSINQLKPTPQTISHPINQSINQTNNRTIELEHCYPSPAELPVADGGLSIDEVGRLIKSCTSHADRLMRQSYFEPVEYPSINQSNNQLNNQSNNDDDISPEDLAAIEAIMAEDFDLDF